MPNIMDFVRMQYENPIVRAQLGFDPSRISTQRPQTVAEPTIMPREVQPVDLIGANDDIDWLTQLDSARNGSTISTPEFSPTSGAKMEAESRSSIDDILKSLTDSREKDREHDRQLAWMSFFSNLASSKNPSLLGGLGEASGALTQTMQQQAPAARASDRDLANAQIKYEQWLQEQQMKQEENASQSDLRSAQADYYRSGRGGGRATEMERALAEIDDPTTPPDRKRILMEWVQTKARGGMDPARRAFEGKRGSAAGTDFAGLQQTLPQINSTMADLELVENSIKELGPMRQNWAAGKLPNVSTEANILDSESTQEALKYVNQTKGAVSDREMTMFKGASLGTDKPMPFNENKVKAAQAIMLRKAQQAQFFDEWYNRYGTTDGAYSAFKKFADTNPIFEIKGTKVNFKKSLEDVRSDESWMNYLNPESAPSAPSGNSNTNGFSNLWGG